MVGHWWRRRGEEEGGNSTYAGISLVSWLENKETEDIQDRERGGQMERRERKHRTVSQRDCKNQRWGERLVNGVTNTLNLLGGETPMQGSSLPQTGCRDMIRKQDSRHTKMLSMRR